jgi:hypothetical protein
MFETIEIRQCLVLRDEASILWMPCGILASQYIEEEWQTLNAPLFITSRNRLALSTQVVT